MVKMQDALYPSKFVNITKPNKLKMCKFQRLSLFFIQDC